MLNILILTWNKVRFYLFIYYLIKVRVIIISRKKKLQNKIAGSVSEMVMYPLYGG